MGPFYSSKNSIQALTHLPLTLVQVCPYPLPSTIGMNLYIGKLKISQQNARRQVICQPGTKLCVPDPVRDNQGKWQGEPLTINKNSGVCLIVGKFPFIEKEVL